MGWGVNAEGRTRTADLRVMKPTEEPENTGVSDTAPTTSPTVPHRPTTDPELARVVFAWDRLPPAIRAGILAMVAAVGEGER